MDMDFEFEFENTIKELGTCADFTEMDEDMWVCLGEYGGEIFNDDDEYGVWGRRFRNGN